jgi:hypothetical protein
MSSSTRGLASTSGAALFVRYEGLMPFLQRISVGDDGAATTICPSCHSSRIEEGARNVSIGGLHISALAEKTLRGGHRCLTPSACSPCSIISEWAAEQITTIRSCMGASPAKCELGHHRLQPSFPNRREY